MLSIILPAYNEEKMISLAETRIADLMDCAQIPYEIVFVDDGSTDHTWEEICKVCDLNPYVKGVHFSRNFGKEPAMFAGLEHVTGDCCVILDCDLQHPPEMIIEMYHLWEQGYEVVEGKKRSRGKESIIHKASANLFYLLISKASGINMESASDFKLLDRKVVNALNQMQEKKVFFRALSFWVGFKRTEVFYEVQDRVEGESKWSTFSLIKYAIRNIGSFSSAPLYFITAMGFVMLLVSVIFGINAVVQKVNGQALGGFTTVIVLNLFSASLIMISLGVIGFYIANIYDEIKGRPRYIVSELYTGKVTDVNSCQKEKQFVTEGEKLESHC